MWELRTEEGPRVFRYKTGSYDRCPVCGQHFVSGEEYYIIVCNAIPEARSRKLKNITVHVGCWDAFCEGVESNDVLAIKLQKHKKPKVKPMTEEQEQRVAAFKQAASLYGYRILSWTRNGCLKARRNESSSSITYNPYTNVLDYNDNKKDFLFKGMLDREEVVRVYNKMHEILGDGKHDDFTALGVIAQVIDETNKIFK